MSQGDTLPMMATLYALSTVTMTVLMYGASVLVIEALTQAVK